LNKYLSFLYFLVYKQFSGSLLHLINKDYDYLEIIQVRLQINY
jgi:hypothetical protein